MRVVSFLVGQVHHLWAVAAAVLLRLTVKRNKPTQQSFAPPAIYPSVGGYRWPPGCRGYRGHRCHLVESARRNRLTGGSGKTIGARPPQDPHTTRADADTPKCNPPSRISSANIDEPLIRELHGKSHSAFVPPWWQYSTTLPRLTLFLLYNITVWQRFC